MRKIIIMGNKNLFRGYRKFASGTDTIFNSSGNRRFFSSTEGNNYIVLLHNVKYRDRFISSLKNELLSLKSIEYKLCFCLQTKDGHIDFGDEIENQFAWSDNNIYDEDFKDRGYQEDRDQFVRYSSIHSDLFHINKIEDVDMYVKGVYDKIVSIKSSDVRHTILVINKVFNKKVVSYKTLKSPLDFNKKRFYSSMCGNFTSRSRSRSKFLLGSSEILHAFPSLNKYYTTTVSRNENLLLNTLSPSHNAINDIIKNPKLNLVEKQLKIEEIVRDY